MKRIFITILVIASIGSLGFGGYKYQHRNDNNAVNDGTNNTQKTNDTSEGGKYLVIKEWGVRFKLHPDLVGDLDYGLSTSKDFLTEIPVELAHFSSKTISDIPGSNCDLFVDSNGSGISGGTGNMLERIKTTNLNDQYKNTFKSSSVLRLDDYWYYRLGSKGSCIGGSEHEQLESDISQKILNSLTSL